MCGTMVPNVWSKFHLPYNNDNKGVVVAFKETHDNDHVWDNGT